MTLKEFILLRHSVLISSGLYKDVKFKSAIDIGLRKNGTSENFLTVDSDIEKTGEEVKNFSLLEDVYADNNGSKVVFEVLPKGKRKYKREEFYFLYT